ncbi:MAG: hypothetical protein NUV82_01550, partial [Candidatus Komeilibacteria bacterium]|nr:hypothetical protein [Candidatus Komeilibacteria bacterium]
MILGRRGKFKRAATPFWFVVGDGDAACSFLRVSSSYSSGRRHRCPSVTEYRNPIGLGEGGGSEEATKRRSVEVRKRIDDDYLRPRFHAS